MNRNFSQVIEGNACIGLREVHVGFLGSAKTKQNVLLQLILGFNPVG